MAVPRCLAIIPDGNRRWARSQNLPASLGHTHGLENCRAITRAAFDRGTQHVVLWTASTSNLKKRNPLEIGHIFKLLKRELTYRMDNPEEIGFHLCGQWQEYNSDQELADLVRRAHERTASGNGQQLTLLFGYDGVTEIAHAAAKAASEGPIDEESIRRNLWTAHVPQVDLLIRTGVEDDPHWSDLLLPWQMRNTQLHFSPLNWPDFSEENLRDAFAHYAKRERRAGA